MTKYRIAKGERIWFYEIVGDIYNRKNWKFRPSGINADYAGRTVVYDHNDVVSELKDVMPELYEQGYWAFRLPINTRSINVILVEEKSIEKIED